MCFFLHTNRNSKSGGQWFNPLHEPHMYTINNNSAAGHNRTPQNKNKNTKKEVKSIGEKF